MANQINPKKLLHSKWTKVQSKGKEKHFIVSKVSFDENKTVTECQLEAVINKHIYHIDWQQLKNDQDWSAGWK
jgi:tryptophan-rich hypothetical protein